MRHSVDNKTHYQPKPDILILQRRTQEFEVSYHTATSRRPAPARHGEKIFIHSSRIIVSNFRALRDISKRHQFNIILYSSVRLAGVVCETSWFGRSEEHTSE